MQLVSEPRGTAANQALFSWAPPSKLLVLSVSAGSGHVRAAEAICANANQRGTMSARHIDVMDYVPTTFRKIYTDAYLSLVKRQPELWAYLYRITNHGTRDSRLQRLRRGIEQFNTKALLQEIAAFKPDAIICTHFLPAEILSQAIQKARLHCPVWVQVTDFDVHGMWIHPNMAGYFVASEEVAFHLQAQGIARHRIHVTGIPIMPEFVSSADKRVSMRRLGLDAGKPTALLMAGGAGIGALDALATRLLDANPTMQLIAMAGRNADLLTSLRALLPKYHPRIVVSGFTSEVMQLMACADVAVTKPGGLSVSECLAMGLPMILNSAIPGQEERNADYLLEQGVALKANNATGLEFRLARLLQDKETLQAMRARARLLARPAAARELIDTVLEHRIAVEHAVQ